MTGLESRVARRVFCAVFVNPETRKKKAIAMNRMRSRFFLPSLICFAALAPRADSAEAPRVSVEGEWKWSFVDPNGNEIHRALKIAKKDGKLTGVVVRDEGRESKVEELRVEGDSISFSYAAERDGQSFTVKYSGKIDGDAIRGNVEIGSNEFPWEAKRAAPAKKEEGWIALIQGRGLAESGWKLRRPADEKHRDGWTLKDGVLANKAPSIDIVHEKNFKDFELHVEFRYPKGSNSGVYLRGNYEIQVEDTHTAKPKPETGKLDTHICGAIYGQKEPSENAALPPGEWQSYDVTLIGNKVTVAHNGKKVIDGFEIPGKTGGALAEVKHGEAGPVMLQGDHGDVEYRNIRVRPIEAKRS